MKLTVVIAFIFSCIVPLSVSSRTRFVHPSLMVKFLYWMGEGSIPDIAKLIIKKSYDISAYGTYIVDYGCEAVYAGFTRGPERIPHELIKYACAIKIAAYANGYIDYFELQFPGAAQNYRSINAMVAMARPFLVRCLTRVGIDLLVDAYLEEPDSSEESNFVMDS